jgi:hypothetical protein
MLKGLVQATRRIESIRLRLEPVPDPSEVLVQSTASGANARGVRVDLLILDSIDDGGDRHIIATRLSGCHNDKWGGGELTRWPLNHQGRLVHVGRHSKISAHSPKVWMSAWGKSAWDKSTKRLELTRSLSEV